MLGKPDKSFFPTEFIIFFEKLAYFELISPFLSDVRVDDSVGLLCGDYRGARIGFLQASFSPQVAIKVEQMAMYYGVKRIVRIGTCGSLGDHPVGQVLLHQGAIREEGTSRCYVPDAFPATASFRFLSDFFQANKDICEVGTTWTTDGRYAESTEKLEKYKSLGAHCVEMETSALYVVSSLRDVEALSISVVSDHPCRDSGTHKGKIDSSSYFELVLPKISQSIERVLEFRKNSQS